MGGDIASFQGYMSLLVASVIASVFVAIFLSSRHKLPLPPGPKPKWFSGNVHQIPKGAYWETYLGWSEAFESPIVYYRTYNRKVVVLNTLKAALDLLDGRSNIYSDRPGAYMYKELVGRGNSVFNISSRDPRFRTYRRMLHDSLNPRMVQSYRLLQEEEMRNVLNGLKTSPEKFVAHYRRNSGAIILKVAYGWTVKSDDDYFVALMGQIFDLGNEVMKPGRWVVDMYPILRFWPAWAPGGWFKRQAAIWREEFRRVETIPYQWAKEQLASGNYDKSFVSQHLEPSDGHIIDAQEDEIIKWCSAGLYAGGADTTAATLTSFTLLMATHPEIQRRAQDEIEEVIGRGRLPTMDDEPSLPYVCAIIKEILRYQPVAPLGLPHCTTKEDEYLGYRIPEGTTCIANIWAMTRDESIYPNPLRFDPDRHIASPDRAAELDPRKIVFGFGRRTCPGVHFAEKTIFLNVACILATYWIARPLDDHGKEIDLPLKWTTLTVTTTHPEPFRCRFLPGPAYHLI